MQMDFRLEKPAKLGGGDRVETPRRFVEKEDLGLVQQRPEKTEALECAGGKGADLAIEDTTEFEALGKFRDASLQHGIGTIIQPAKEAKILASGQTRIETQVGSSVVTKMASHRGRVVHRVVSGQLGRAARGDKERG
jgi:hypothetical protein